MAQGSMTDVFSGLKCQCGYNLAKRRNRQGDLCLDCFNCGQQFKQHGLVHSAVEERIERTEIMEPEYYTKILEELTT
jgi:hypothetical protein